MPLPALLTGIRGCMVHAGSMSDIEKWAKAVKFSCARIE
jgi:hypothetical protein